MLTITHTWECDECGRKEVKEQHGINLNYQTIRYSELPRLWHHIRGRMVCEDHKITIEEPGCKICKGKTFWEMWDERVKKAMKAGLDMPIPDPNNSKCGFCERKLKA